MSMRLAGVETSPIFATQGDIGSYHWLIARLASGDPNVTIDPHHKFGDVVLASRRREPGLGIIAISTVAGTVEESARELVAQRVSALPPIAGRFDTEVELVFIGSPEQDEDELNKQGIRCYAQKEAWLQCEPELEAKFSHIPWSKGGESTALIKEVLMRNEYEAERKGRMRNVAIGPRHAAELLGAKVLRAEQLNPPGSVTSFYVLQRDPRQTLFVDDPLKTDVRTVISVAHPEDDPRFPLYQRELSKCLELIERVGLQVGRFIPFNIGDFTKHRSDQRRGGGIFEIVADLYDEELTELIARINGLHGNDGAHGPFSAKRLGCYPWYPEEPVQDLDAILPKLTDIPVTQPVQMAMLAPWDIPEGRITSNTLPTSTKKQKQVYGQTKLL